MASEEPLLASSQNDAPDLSAEVAHQAKAVLGIGLANEYITDFEGAVLKDEKENIQKKYAARHPDGRHDGRPPQGLPFDGKFSLAFSGGGIRAAAFQAGVLWRLAKENKLKDVEYFSAVSGGGYILSSFASHCCDPADQPEKGKVKEWYLKVVAQTIDRMQENAGDFVRDCVKDPGGPRRNAGLFPRICDIFILLGITFFSIAVNPCFFMLTIAMPVAHQISVFFAGSLRAAFCAPDTAEWNDLFGDSSMDTAVLYVGGTFLVLLSITRILRSVLPMCKVKPWEKGTPRERETTAAMLGNIFSAVFLRAAIFFLVFYVFVNAVPYLFRVQFPQAQRTSMCQTYISHHSQLNVDDVPCNDFVWTMYSQSHKPWFMMPVFDSMRNNHTKTAVRTQVDSDDSGLIQAIKETIREFRSASVGIFFIAVVLVAFLLSPLLGGGVTRKALAFLGPAILLFVMVVFVRMAVYDALFYAGQGKIHDFNHRFLASSYFWCVLLLPFYAEIRSSLHFYYKRSLVGNFFKGGKDVDIEKLGEVQFPYCPFVLMTGTSSDFQPPGDDDTISELSFTALHCGSLETQYCKMPMAGCNTLGKCAALTGAGCMDAMTLSMSDAVSMRFWLEFLNLSWGDFIMFNPSVSGVVNKGFRFSLRVPSNMVLVFIFIIWSAAYLCNQNDIFNMGGARCHTGRKLYTIGVYTMLAIIAASFFYWVPVLSVFSLSPYLRQFLQATRYIFQGNHPPRMLYVTDGGVQDCTAINQLLMRKCKRILLIQAPADPHDDFAVLKHAMGVAKEQRMCCFYDPKDPRIDIWHPTDGLFAKFKGSLDEKDAPTFLHIGIFYGYVAGPDTNGQKTIPDIGHLYIVKNRLPLAFQGQPVEPPLSEGEIRYGQYSENREDPWVPEAWQKCPETDKLGAWGCCDCCHTNGFNCGPKFPHGNFNGYLFLTPMWFSSLVRLGYALSETAVEKITRKENLSWEWEHGLKKTWHW